MEQQSNLKTSAKNEFKQMEVENELEKKIKKFPIKKLSREKIKEIALNATKDFKLKCNIELISMQKFIPIAKKNPLIKEVLDEGFSFSELNIPAVIHHAESETIYLCDEIINKLIKNEPEEIKQKFIKSLVYHELFHVLDESKVKIFNIKECIKSEERVCKEFEKKYPELAIIGKKIQRKNDILS